VRTLTDAATESGVIQLGIHIAPDVQNLRATPAMIATAVYQGGVAKDVATETHDLTVQAILDTMWLPECKD
jgi:hypothetical protein